MEIREASEEEIGQLYKKFVLPNFPKNEIKPLRSILKMFRAGCYRVAVLSDQGEPAAAAFMAARPGKLWLLDYLAVDPGLRCRGCGSTLLKAAAERYTDGLPMLIETESMRSAQNAEQEKLRLRRNSFYERNGARDTGIVTLVFGVEYTIWQMNGMPANAASELEALYRTMVGRLPCLRHYRTLKK